MTYDELVRALRRHYPDRRLDDSRCITYLLDELNVMTMTSSAFGLALEQGRAGFRHYENAKYYTSVGAARKTLAIADSQYRKLHATVAAGTEAFPTSGFENPAAY